MALLKETFAKHSNGFGVEISFHECPFSVKTPPQLKSVSSLCHCINTLPEFVDQRRIHKLHLPPRNDRS